MKKGLALFLSLVLLLSVMVTASAESTLPTTWDLTSVYGSVDEWQADYDTVMEMLNNYEQYRGKLNNAQDIYDYLQFSYYTELTRLQNKLSLYASLGSSLDATDPVFAQLNAKLSAMNVKEAQDLLLRIPRFSPCPWKNGRRSSPIPFLLITAMR